MAVGVIKVDMNISTFNKGFNTDYSNTGGYTLTLKPCVVEDRLYFEAIKSKETWITSAFNFLARRKAFLRFK